MATKEDDKLRDLAAGLPRQEGLVRLSPEGPEDGADKSAEDAQEDGADARPTALGTGRYVHAAFFGAGILAAYLCGKILFGVWNHLAEWPMAVEALPKLVEYGEEERESLTRIVGALVGVLIVLRTYRKPHIRTWADEVAAELSRVTWPNRETVTNGTIVVVVASLAAAVYVAVLDRLWGYLTTLVYGA